MAQHLNQTQQQMHRIYLNLESESDFCYSSMNYARSWPDHNEVYVYNVFLNFVPAEYDRVHVISIKKLYLALLFWLITGDQMTPLYSC
jgi:hypothetical protein